jgi:hypothetical protein
MSFIRTFLSFRRYEQVTLTVSILTLVSAVIYAGVTYRMWREMRAQNSTAQGQLQAAQGQAAAAQSQLEASDRPWLKLDFAVSGLAPDGKNGIIFGSDGGMQMNVVPIITNTGHSVATNVFAVVAAILIPQNGDFTRRPENVQAEYCKKAAR